jgi:hypothetical protein
LQPSQLRAQGDVVTHVIEYAGQSLDTLRAVLITLYTEGLLQFGRVGQIQIRAVVGQDAMPSPSQDFSILPVEFVKIVPRDLMKMDEQGGINFLPGLT